MSLEYADCKECGAAGLLVCYGDTFQDIGAPTYAIFCEGCGNEGPIRTSKAAAVQDWAMLGKRRGGDIMQDAIAQVMADNGFTLVMCQISIPTVMENKGRELNKLAKVVCPRQHAKWVHWDSRRDTYCYVCGDSTRMSYTGEMQLE